MKEYYVYYLIDSSNNKVFYVGKGTHKRMYYHEQSVKKGRKLHNWKLHKKIKHLLKENVKIQYAQVFHTSDEKEAYKVEEQYQRKFGLDNLCNLRYGTPYFNNRKGYNHSNKTNNKISKTRSERIQSGEIQIWNKGLTKETSKKVAKNAENIKKTIKENGSWNKDLTKEIDNRIKPCSEELKNKLSKERKGKTWEELYGKEKADEMKRKNSENRKGIPNPHKGKTNIEIFGKKRAREIFEKHSKMRKGRTAWNKGKTLEETHCKERAQEIRKKQSEAAKNRKKKSKSYKTIIKK